MTRISAAFLAVLASALLAPSIARAQTAQPTPPGTKTDKPGTITSTLPAHTVLTQHETLTVHGQRGAPAQLPPATIEAPVKPRGFHLNQGPMHKPSDCQTGYTNIGGQPARAGELYTSLGHRACQPH